MREVLIFVTMAPARITPTGAPLSDAFGNDRAALSGTFAASMERLIGVVSKTISAPAAMVALLGDDRRSFCAGDMRRDWFAHDAGALIRSGLLQRTLDNGGTLSLADLHAMDGDVALRNAAVELRIVSMAAATFASDYGRVGGMLCVLDDVPRKWTS